MVRLQDSSFRLQEIIAAPAFPIQGPPSHWRKRLRSSNQDARPPLDVQDWIRYNSKSSTYAMPHTRQHLLVYGRW